MARTNSKRVLALALRLFAIAVLSAACASVLGIETTKRTNRAASGYGNGYEGCRRNSCGECLSQAHTTACQGPAGYGTGYEGCRAGDCSQCQNAHNDECESQLGYGSDGYEGCRRSEGVCDECISDDHRCLCQAGTTDCFLVDGDAGVNPQICDQSNLDDCADCLCGSCDLSTCLADTACNEIFSCVALHSCNPSLTATDTCYTDQLCKGVIDNAGGPMDPAYTAMLSVVNCSNIQQCSCTFGAPGTPGICEGGTDCPSEGGTGASQCQSPGCTGCETTSAQCLCNGNSVDECLTAVLGRSCEAHFEAENDACHTCSCGVCASELLSCFDDPESACMMLARCINIHGCSGDECDTPETCGDLLARHGGVAGESFQMATALAQCQAGECPCTHQPDVAAIACGAGQCAAFVDGDADAGADSLPACCFEQGGPHCGLDVTGVLYTGCEPRGLSGSPSAACAGLQTEDEFPYHGAFLPGCCRPSNSDSAMNGGPGVCGYNDTVTGLKCLPIEKITGMSTTPTACNYVR